MLERFRAAPLSSSFALVGLFGFTAVLFFWNYFTSIVLNESWAFTLALFFLIVFIASMISLMKAPISDDYVLKYMMEPMQTKKVPRDKPIQRVIRRGVKRKKIKK